ncbi:MAG: hypothetical protein R3E58_13515 [Phycisphaerae bacterium]
MTDTENTKAPSFANSQGMRVLAVFALLVAMMVAFKAPYALVLWSLDGAVALLILITATCAGLGIVRLLHLSVTGWHFQIALSAGLGLGWLSLLTLAYGWAGFVAAKHRYILPAIFLASGAVGVLFAHPLTGMTPARMNSLGFAGLFW